jgi:Co/Zn/Cd efflux system component
MDCCDRENYLSRETINKLKGILYFVFFINAGMFLIELASGIVAHSNSLVADSLDMLGDAFVYGLSLFVLSKHHNVQARASLIKGIVMLLLGLYVFWESFYKILYPSVPSAQTITLIGILALVANVICFSLLTRHRDKNINMKSSWICSRNDVYGNVSVIGAGILVGYFNSMWPDIIVGLGIAGLVLYFSVKIIIESKTYCVKK